MNNNDFQKLLRRLKNMSITTNSDGETVVTKHDFEQFQKILAQTLVALYEECSH